MSAAIKEAHVLRVLIVDDDATWVSAIERMLELVGAPQFQIKTVNDGGLAAIIIAQEFKPNLIILDEFFHRSDGASAEDVVSQLADSCPGAGISVLILARDLEYTGDRHSALRRKQDLSKGGQINVWECDRLGFAREVQSTLSPILPDRSWLAFSDENAQVNLQPRHQLAAHEDAILIAHALTSKGSRVPVDPWHERTKSSDELQKCDVGARPLIDTGNCSSRVHASRKFILFLSAISEGLRRIRVPFFVRKHDL